MDFLKNRHGRRRSLGALNVLSGAGTDNDPSHEAGGGDDVNGEKEPAKKVKKEPKESKKKKKDSKDEHPTPAALVFPPHRAFSPRAHVQQDGSEAITLEIPSPTQIPTVMPIPPTPTTPATPTQASTLPKSKPLARSTSASARTTLGNLAFGRSTDSIPLAKGNSLGASYNRDFSSSNPHLSNFGANLDVASPGTKSKGKPLIIRSMSSLFSSSVHSNTPAAPSGGSPPSTPPAHPELQPNRPSISAFSPFSKAKSKRAYSTHGHGGGSENHGTTSNAPSSGSNHGHGSYGPGAGIGYTPANARQGTLFGHFGLSLSRSSTRSRTTSTNTSNTKYNSDSDDDGALYTKSREGGWAGTYGDEDQEEEEDDIRRPSGLGRSASFSSYRSMPSPVEDEFPEPVHTVEEEGPKKSGVKAAMLKETLIRVFGSDTYGSRDAPMIEDDLPTAKPKFELESNGTLVQLHDTHSQSQTSLIREESPAEYERVRATSSPNLLRSLSQRIRTKPSISALKLKIRKDQHADTLDESSRPPTPPAKFTWPKEVPSEVLENILVFLPRSKCAQFARISKSFASAARSALYTKLVICRLGSYTTPSDQDSETPMKMKPEVFEKLARLLAARPDLTDLVRVFVCEEWPIGGSGRRHRRGKTTISHFIEDDSIDSDNEEDQSPHQDPNWDWEWNEDRLAALAATFIRAFQRMHRLTGLILPSFELRLLRHHSAFGLASLTFLDERFGSRKATKGEPDKREERRLQELLAWLDGQVNIKSLRFPLLVDSAPMNAPVRDERLRLNSTSANVPFLTSSPLTPQVATFNIATTTESPVYSLFPSPSAVVIQSPTNDISSSAPSGASSSTTPAGLNIEIPTFTVPRSPTRSSHFATTPITSPTLLPNLEILQGPPSLITLFSTPIQPCTSPIAVPGPSNPRRPLRSVIINIDSTLYTGLRPAALLSALQPPSVPSSSSNSPDSSDDSPNVPYFANEDVKQVQEIGFKFGMVVDRRTVEKVLSAAGASLGGGDERGRADGDIHKLYTCPGVEVLNVELTAPSHSGRDVKFEEALYRIIHNVLPRYRVLKILRLRLHREPNSSSSSQISPTIPATIPNPKLPIPETPKASRTTFSTATRPSTATSTSSSLLTPAASFTLLQTASQALAQIADSYSASIPPSPISLSKFPAPPPGIAASATPSSPLPFPSLPSPSTPGIHKDETSSITAEMATTQRMSDKDKVHLTMWLKQCPSLTYVKFLDGGVWQKEA